MWEWDDVNHNVAIPVFLGTDGGELCAVVLQTEAGAHLAGVAPSHAKVVLVSVPADVDAFTLELYQADASSDRLTELRASREFRTGAAGGASSSYLLRLYNPNTLRGMELPYTINERGGLPEEYLAQCVGEGDDEIVWAAVASMNETYSGPIRQVFLQKSGDGQAAVAGLRVHFEYDGGGAGVGDGGALEQGWAASSPGLKIRIDFRSLNVSAAEAGPMFRLFWIPSATGEAQIVQGSTAVKVASDSSQADLDFYARLPNAAPFDVFGLQYWGPGPVEVVQPGGILETPPPSGVKAGAPVTTVACMYGPSGLVSLGHAADYGPKIAERLPPLPGNPVMRSASWAVEKRIFDKESPPQTPNGLLAPAHAYIAFEGFQVSARDETTKADVLGALNWLGIYSDRLPDFLRAPELFAAVAHFEQLRNRLTSRRGTSTLSEHSGFVERLALFAGEGFPENGSLDEEWATFKRLIA